MSTIKVKFLYNDDKIKLIRILTDFTVEDFLSEIRELFENVDTKICAFLNGSKLDENEILAYHLTDLDTDVIIVAPEGTKIPELPNLNRDK